MKIVIQTQHKENYAWNEDGSLGTGENAYWKFKGGDTYIVKCAFSEACDAEFRKSALDAVTSESDGFIEYVLDWQIIDDADFVESDHVEEWETPTYMWFDGDAWVCHKVTKNDEFGHMRFEISKKYETWVQSQDGERSEYELSFEMINGNYVLHEDLEEWIKVYAPKEAA